MEDIRKRKLTNNQGGIWKIVSGSKMSAAVTAVEVTMAREKVEINERNEVEREIMTCLSKRFSLTNDNSTMGDEFTPKMIYLAEKKKVQRIY